ncbi:transposase, partial [Bifidobacterium longum]|uniref:transposase n=1 Tax=Bifidobacterium longum TaxID=216816 RepID=UPI001F61AC05
MAVDNHTFVNALLWMCRTGAPWRDLPECYGKWVTVYQRFDRWSGNGATGCLSTALQEERIIGVEIRVPAMDSTGGKVHQHAAGAPKKGAPGPSASPGEGGTPKSAWYPTVFSQVGVSCFVTNFFRFGAGAVLLDSSLI